MAKRRDFVKRRLCILPTMSCNLRPNHCCSNTTCRCNLWGQNCRYRYNILSLNFPTDGFYLKVPHNLWQGVLTLKTHNKYFWFKYIMKINMLFRRCLRMGFFQRWGRRKWNNTQRRINTYSKESDFSNVISVAK